MRLSLRRACRHRGVDPSTGWAVIVLAGSGWTPFGVRATEAEVNTLLARVKAMGSPTARKGKISGLLEGELVGG